MSRGLSYNFVETDSSAIEAQMTASYEEKTGRTLQPGDPDRIFISWIAGIITQERVLINYAGNQNLPSSAMGDNLDAIGKFLYNTERKEAQAAVCSVKIIISTPPESAIIIPAGTRISDISKALTWQTVEESIIPIGEIEITVKAECQTVGSTGNGYAPGQINTLLDVDNIPYLKLIENTDMTNGGAERETDDQYFERMRKSLNAYSTAGPRGAYEYWAKSVSTHIADVAVVQPTEISKAGHVYIYALMDDGTIADSGTKAAISTVCNADTVRPLTDVVDVLDASQVTYNIDIKYYINDESELSATDIDIAVSNAVNEYTRWQSAKIGRDINPSKLSWLLGSTGVKRVELTEPLFTSLKNGDDGSTPQIAKLGTVSIKNGGYEDE